MRLSLAACLKAQKANSSFKQQLQEKRRVFSELASSAEGDQEDAYIKGLAQHMIFTFHANQKEQRPCHKMPSFGRQ